MWLVSIVHALVRNMDNEATQEDIIIKAFRARPEDSQFMMRNFGGDEVNIVGQATVTLSCGEHKIQVTLLVQNGTQLELLLGILMF